MKYSSHKWTTVKGQGDLIVTGPDKLLSLVAEMEEISLTDAANHLRVPKNVVEKWCETLELEGVLRTEQTIKDIVLLSNEKHSFKKTYKKSFLRHIKAINGNTKTWEMDMLLKKQQEVNKNIRELDIKAEKLKVFEKLKIENNKILRSIDKKEKNIETLKSDLEKHEEKLDKFKQDLENKANIISEREIKVKTRSDDIISLAKDFQKKEKELFAEKKNIDNINKQLQKEEMTINDKKLKIQQKYDELLTKEKKLNEREQKVIQKFDKFNVQKKYLAEQNARLLLRESRILEQVRDIVDRTNVLSEKEMKVNKRYDELLQLRSTVLNTWGVQDAKEDILISA